MKRSQQLSRILAISLLGTSLLVTACNAEPRAFETPKSVLLESHQQKENQTSENNKTESKVNSGGQQKPSVPSQTNPVKPLMDEEFVFAGGVRLGMGYEEVLKILGGYDKAYENAPGVKSFIKNGVHYGFYQIHETSTDQSNPKIDGVFQLKNATLSETSKVVFPRGIRVGDSIEDVLNKFPGKDKVLRKWAHQDIYGQESGPRAYLEFAMYDECYHLVVRATENLMRVNFDRKNNVRFIEIYGEGL